MIGNKIMINPRPKKSVVGECLRAHHEGVSEFYILPFYVLAGQRRYNGSENQKRSWSTRSIGRDLPKEKRDDLAMSQDAHPPIPPSGKRFSRIPIVSVVNDVCR